jgi:DNA-binding CsgD family transcriptional regulator
MRRTKAQRKARELEIAAERAEWDRQFSVGMPEHVLGKIDSPSELSDALSDAGTAYAWNGVRYDDESGEPYQNPAPDDLGANVERQEEAQLTAEELRRKYADLWYIRGGAKQIAAAERISLSTVYAHMKRLRITK